MSLALACALALSAVPTRADEPTEAEIAAARAIFNEAKDLEKAGQWADAQARFKKVAEVRMTPQVRFHLALCDENLGHLVSAINGFELAAEEAKQAGALATDVAENAPGRAEALRKRVPHVRIEVKGKLGSGKVLLDGAPVAAALLGTDIPVDPGTRTVELERGGKTAFKKELSLAEEAKETVEIDAGEGEAPVPSASASAVPIAPPAGLSFPPPLPAIVAGGVGVLSLGGAGVFFALRESTISEVRATCDDPKRDKGCDKRKRSVADDGKTYTLLTNVLLGVGAAGVAAGAVLWLVLPGNAPPDQQGGPGAAGAANAKRGFVAVGLAADGVRVHGSF